MDVEKDPRGSWSATTKVALSGGKELRLITMKRFSGHISTVATVWTPYGAPTLNKPFGGLLSTTRKDFNVELSKTTNACTRKNVETQHFKIDLEALKLRAEAHYAKGE
jgi:hypothetical protein